MMEGQQGYESTYDPQQGHRHTIRPRLYHYIITDIS